jgi:hypothetical protein
MQQFRRFQRELNFHKIVFSHDSIFHLRLKTNNPFQRETVHKPFQTIFAHFVWLRENFREIWLLQIEYLLIRFSYDN